MKRKICHKIFKKASLPQEGNLQIKLALGFLLYWKKLAFPQKLTPNPIYKGRASIYIILRCVHMQTNGRIDKDMH